MRRRRVLAGSAVLLAVIGGMLTNVVTSMYPVPASWRGWLTAVFLIVLFAAAVLASISVEADQRTPATRLAKDRSVPTTVAVRGSAGLAITATITLLGFVCSCSIASIVNPPGKPTPPKIGDCVLPDGPLAVAVGRHANASPPRITSEISDAIRYATEIQTQLTIVRIDGDPAIVHQTNIKLTSRNDAARRAEVQGWLTATIRAIDKVLPQQPEADPIGALQVAARSAGNVGTVILLDPGTQTMAPLDMTVPGAFNRPPLQTVADLKTHQQIPDLTGRTVIFGGLGNVAEPQPSLGQQGRQQLQAIWQAILREANAQCVAFVATAYTATPIPESGSFPKVQVVVPDRSTPSPEA